MADSLRLILADSPEDRDALAQRLPDVDVRVFDAIQDADDDELRDWAELRDVVVVVAADAGPAARARARDAVERVRGVANEVLAVAHPSGRFTWLEGLDTPGEALAWLRGLPRLAPRGSRPEDAAAAAGNGRHVATVEADDCQPLPRENWPAPPGPAAYHGLAGRAVKLIEPETEADPVGILTQCLVSFGNAVGRGPFMSVDGVRHGTNEFLVVVGETAAARKNTAKARALEMLQDIDSDWHGRRIRSGLSSGEGVITPVRDSVWSKLPRKENGRIVGSEDVMTDEGEPDKRLLVVESEFGSVLRALQREGNRLSALLRAAWDGDSLSTMTKSPLRATNPHISIIGHITFHELSNLLSGLEIANGLANRVMWICVRRSRHLPFGGRGVDLGPIRTGFRDALDFARDVGEMTLTKGARALYSDHYRRLSTPAAGRIGEVTSRAAAHVLRWSMLYALAGRSGVVAADHLEAALAVVDASNRAACHIFGDTLGHPDAEKVLDALRVASGGLTRSEISTRVFKGNAPRSRIEAALTFLQQHGRIVEERRVGPNGRPVWTYRANEINEFNEITPPTIGLNSSNSLISCFVLPNGAAGPDDEGGWIE